MLQKKILSVLEQDSNSLKKASVKPARAVIANERIFQLAARSLGVHIINICLMTRCLC